MTQARPWLCCPITQRSDTSRQRGKRHAGQAGEEGAAHAAPQCARQRHRRGRLGRAGRHRAGRQGNGSRDARPQDGGGTRSPRASRSSSSARSSALPPRTSRPAATCTRTTARSPPSSATTPSPKVRATRSCLPPEARATFEGFRRANGKAGTRNYIGILTSVNCSASVARFMAEAVNRSGILEQYPNVDGVVSFVHGTGCGLAAKGEGYEALERTQWGYAGHPNLSAALVVGLGCEVFQIARLKEKYGLIEGDNFRSMTIQDTGGTKKTIEAGVARIKEMLPLANAGAPRDDFRQRADARPAVRRLGRLFRHHRQPGARRRRRPAGAPRRHRRAVRDARDLRRRAPADPPRTQQATSARSWSASSSGGRPTAPRTTARWTTIPRPATRRAG